MVEELQTAERGVGTPRGVWPSWTSASASTPEPMIAGNIGSEAIMSYTVIGDAVNLGARLESLNKQYGTRIIISDATRAAPGRPIHTSAAWRSRGEGQDAAGGDFRGRRPR